MDAQRLTISVGTETVSALLLRPANAKALYLFAHGAGAGMSHRAMESNAQGLAERGIATLRYQFLYMEKGSRTRSYARLRRRRCGLRPICRCLPEAAHLVDG